jgi:hypothetical protein
MCAKAGLHNHTEQIVLNWDTPELQQHYIQTTPAAAVQSAGICTTASTNWLGHHIQAYAPLVGHAGPSEFSRPASPDNLLPP